MTSQKWSPEPWTILPGDGGGPEIVGHSPRWPGRVRDIARVLYFNGSEDPEVWHNASRILACVNALAGIPDPAAALQAAREILVSVAGGICTCGPDYPRLENANWETMRATGPHRSDCVIGNAQKVLALLTPKESQ